MIFNTKVVISVLTSLTALGAVGGVVAYVLDKNSMSEEEVQTMVEINKNLVGDKVCERVGDRQRDNWREICRKDRPIFREVEDTVEKIRVTSKVNEKENLNTPPNLHIQSFGEGVIDGVNEKVGRINFSGK